MRRGGRGGFNGNKGPSVASIVGDTMNEVGEKNYNNEDESSLFPSVSIPNPADLTERDIYLVQKQRELWYNAETRMDSQDQSGAINLSAYPITQPARNILFNTDNVATEVILPPELLVTYNGQGRPDTLIMSKKDGIGSGFLQPKAFESTISALEKKEVSGHKVRIIEMDRVSGIYITYRLPMIIYRTMQQKMILEMK